MRFEEITLRKITKSWLTKRIDPKTIRHIQVQFISFISKQSDMVADRDNVVAIFETCCFGNYFMGLVLEWHRHTYTLYNIMIAGIPFVLAGQLKTNTPHYIHFLLFAPKGILLNDPHRAGRFNS